MRWRLPKYFVAVSAIGTLIGGTVVLREAIVGGSKKLGPEIRADGKVIIVTGSNTGIGKETVRDFAKRGATVYMACRDMFKCSTARAEIIRESLNRNIYCRQCDLEDFESIHKFVTAFKSREKRLDVLVNNAGVMWSPKLVTKQGIELQLGVNHMGHFLLTDLLLDTLMASAASRVVVVSSIAHTRGKINFEDLNSDKSYDSTAAYNQSKLANVLFTKELSKRLAGTGVTVNALHPGLVYTEIGRHTGVFNSILGSIFMTPVLKFFLKTPIQGSYTTIYVALEPSLQRVTGEFFIDSVEVAVAPAAEDNEVALRLWLTSEKWTSKYRQPQTDVCTNFKPENEAFSLPS